MTSAGGSPAPADERRGTASDPTWSPTTTGQIAFASGGAIFTISTSGGAATALTITGPTGALSHPAWSPDGTFDRVPGERRHEHPDLGRRRRRRHGDEGDGQQHVRRGQDRAELGADLGRSRLCGRGSGDLQLDPGRRRRLGSTGPEHPNTSTTDSTPDWQTVVPLNTVLPSINGGVSPQTGQLLSASNGSWSGAITVGFTYQWERCNSSGAILRDYRRRDRSDLRGRLRGHRTDAPRRRDRVERRGTEHTGDFGSDRRRHPCRHRQPAGEHRLPGHHPSRRPRGAQRRRHAVHLERDVDRLVPADVHVSVEEVRLADGELLPDRRRDAEHVHRDAGSVRADDPGRGDGDELRGRGGAELRVDAGSSARSRRASA